MLIPHPQLSFAQRLRVFLRERHMDENVCAAVMALNDYRPSPFTVSVGPGPSVKVESKPGFEDVPAYLQKYVGVVVLSLILKLDPVFVASRVKEEWS